MITNKPKKGQILVFDDNYNQEAKDPEELKINDENLGAIISNLKNKVNELDEQIISLMKKNKMILEILLMLIEQANLNLTQQQLLVLKNKGGNENV